MINNILLMSFGAGLLCQLLILITYSFRNIMSQVKKRKVGNLNVISKKEMDFLKDLPANILKNKMHELNFSDEHDFDFPSGVKS